MHQFPRSEDLRCENQAESKSQLRPNLGCRHLGATERVLALASMCIAQLGSRQEKNTQEKLSWLRYPRPTECKLEKTTGKLTEAEVMTVIDCERLQSKY